MSGRIKHMERSHKSYRGKANNPEFARFGRNAETKAYANRLKSSIFSRFFSRLKGDK